MSWLKKLFKDSRHKDSGGHYHENAEVDDFQEGYADEDIDHAIALSLSEEENKKGKAIDNKPDLEEDEQLAIAIQESLNVESPPSPPSRNAEIYDPFQFIPAPYTRRCAGCNQEIDHRSLIAMGSAWHPECFICHGCNQPIYELEFSIQGDEPYHSSCHKELYYHLKCDVCKQFIPTNQMGKIEYRVHPFWKKKYCPSHEHDGTPRCCSCERIESRDTTYVTLDDGRKLCLECLRFGIMDNTECQPLYIDIQEFYEGLNMKVQQQIPMLLVERQALNEAMEGEKNGHHHFPETRGLCLSEEQIIKTVLRKPIIGPGSKMKGMLTGSYRLIRQCEVTAILILYGLPRLLTGNILAHEMMHAWLRLNGFRTLRPEVEEGICQVLGYLWLDSEIVSGTGGSQASTSSSSSSSTMSSKKGPKTEDEKKLGEFFKYQIESDSSSAYGDGFRAGYKAVLQYGLRRTLDHIKMTGNFP